MVRQASACDGEIAIDSCQFVLAVESDGAWFGVATPARPVVIFGNGLHTSQHDAPCQSVSVLAYGHPDHPLAVHVTRDNL